MMEDIEIELKIKVQQPKKFFSWLKKNATRLGEFAQTDYYFDPPHKSFITLDSEGQKRAVDYLRVRVDGKGHGHFGFKRIHDTHHDEIESEVEKPHKVIQILHHLGFRQTAVIEKHRTSYRFNEYQFDCDEVKDLGFFVEIELKEEISDLIQGKKKIETFLKKLDIGAWEEAKGGYVAMMWNKKIRKSKLCI